MTLRESARSIFDAALAAGDVRPLVAQVLAGIAKPERGRVLVVGAGKASGAMAAAVEAAWGDRITDGVVAVKDGYTAPTRRVRVVEAGHPVREVAATFGVSVSSVVKWSQRKRQTGSVAAKPMGSRQARSLAADRKSVV